LAYAPDQWDYLLNANLALRSMLATECRYTFCGHLHEQRLFHAGQSGRAGEYVPKPGAPIKLRDDRQWLVLGVSNAGIQTLHTMPPQALAEPQTVPQPFAHLLARHWPLGRDRHDDKGPDAR